MKKKYFSIFIMIIIPVLLSGLLTCSDTGGTATVTINLGFPGHESAHNQSFIDRLLGLFLEKAYAQPPDNIESILVRVTGPGMGDIEYGFSETNTSSITIAVPAGKSRTISVIASVSPSSPSAARTFTGTATLDLSPGETKSISITMIVSETKIVLPDYFNDRIIQIDDIKGTNMITNGVSFPYDIDFDSRGRIYIARDAEPGVVRIDDINDTNLIPIVAGSSATAMTIDRVNNIIYYYSGSELYSVNMDGSEPTTYSMVSDDIQTISGMAVDENGILYIAGTNVSGLDRIFKYNPGNTLGSRVSAEYNNTTILSEPWDVMIKPPYIYVTNLYGADGERILQLNADLQLLDSYGNEASSVNTNPGMFYGPRKFVAELNERIIIIDDDPSTFIDKLVSMDDIDGNGWETLPTSGDGQSLFLFYDDPA